MDHETKMKILTTSVYNVIIWLSRHSDDSDLSKWAVKQETFIQPHNCYDLICKVLLKICKSKDEYTFNAVQKIIEREFGTVSGDMS